MVLMRNSYLISINFQRQPGEESSAINNNVGLKSILKPNFWYDYGTTSFPISDFKYTRFHFKNHQTHDFMLDLKTVF